MRTAGGGHEAAGCELSAKFYCTDQKGAGLQLGGVLQAEARSSPATAARASLEARYAELDCVLQVEAMKRRDMYQRNQLLHKIQSETEKAHDLLEQRTSLQQQRKMANMTASFQRQKLLQVRWGLLQAACRPA